MEALVPKYFSKYTLDTGFLKRPQYSPHASGTWWAVHHPCRPSRPGSQGTGEDLPVRQPHGPMDLACPGTLQQSTISRPGGHSCLKTKLISPKPMGSLQAGGAPRRPLGSMAPQEAGSVPASTLLP